MKHRDLNGLTRPILMYHSGSSEFVSINYKEITAQIDYVCRSLVVSDADDVRQRILLRLLSKSKTDSKACSTKNLLSTIYFYASSCMNSLSKNREIPSGFIDPEYEDDNFKKVEDSIYIDQIDKLIEWSSLDDQCKKIYSLLREGHTALDISKITGFSHFLVVRCTSKIRDLFKKFSKDSLSSCIISQ